MCGMKAIRHKGDSYSGRHSTSGDFFGLETENETSTKSMEVPRRVYSRSRSWRGCY